MAHRRGPLQEQVGVVLPRVADAAEHLDAVLRAPERRLWRERRGGSEGHRGPCRTRLVVEGAGGVPDRSAGRLEGDEHLGHPVLHGLELPDRTAELRPGSGRVRLPSRRTTRSRPSASADASSVGQLGDRRTRAAGDAIAGTATASRCTSARRRVGSKLGRSVIATSSRSITHQTCSPLDVDRQEQHVGHRAGPHGGHRAETRRARRRRSAWRGAAGQTRSRGRTRRCTCRRPACARAPSPEPIGRWRSPRSPWAGTGRRARRGRSARAPPPTRRRRSPARRPPRAPRGRASRGRPARATSRASLVGRLEHGACGGHRRVRLQPSAGRGGQRDVLVGQRQAHALRLTAIPEQWRHSGPCVESVTVTAGMCPAAGGGTAPPRSRG